MLEIRPFHLMNLHEPLHTARSPWTASAHLALLLPPCTPKAHSSSASMWRDTCRGTGRQPTRPRAACARHVPLPSAPAAAPPLPLPALPCAAMVVRAVGPGNGGQVLPWCCGCPNASRAQPYSGYHVTVDGDDRVVAVAFRTVRSFGWSWGHSGRVKLPLGAAVAEQEADVPQAAPFLDRACAMPLDFRALQGHASVASYVHTYGACTGGYGQLHLARCMHGPRAELPVRNARSVTPVPVKHPHPSTLAAT